MEYSGEDRGETMSEKTVLHKQKKKRILPRCPEPLGFKLWAQALLINTPGEEGDRQKTIDAMRHTLDDIEEYGLSKPVEEEK